jgi:hypothetical protein
MQFNHAQILGDDWLYLMDRWVIYQLTPGWQMPRQLARLMKMYLPLVGLEAMVRPIINMSA